MMLSIVVNLRWKEITRLSILKPCLLSPSEKAVVFLEPSG